jgi:transcriptional regulator with XRE-family HTH domain
MTGGINLLDLREIVGARLKRARLKKGLKQKDVAVSVGIGSNLVCRYESGERMPDLQTAHALCQLLDIKMDDLFGVASRENLLITLLNEPLSPGAAADAQKPASVSPELVFLFEVMRDRERVREIVGLVANMPESKLNRIIKYINVFERGEEDE